VNDRTVRLPGGRQMSYVTFGAPDGAPVVVLDGPGARTQARAATELAVDLGVSLIAPDRPGFGRSTSHPGGNLLTFADDLGILTEHLGLDRFGVWCQSGGSPFALAAAYRMPGRIHHLGMVGAIGPLDAPRATEGMSRAVRFTFWSARRAPLLVEWEFRVLAALHRRSPERAARALTRTRPPEDRRVMRRRDVWPVLVASMGELVQSPAATRREFQLMARPWGFDPSEVRVPTTLWVGSADNVHPVGMSRHLADRIPDATLHVIEGGATFDLLDRREEMLRTVAPGHRRGIRTTGRRAADEDPRARARATRDASRIRR
jgi:pimeloyl-ACP methyl ester carboxylesterase